MAAGVILVAMLAMSPWLALRPACASLVLLALCLWLFRRGGWAHLALPVVVAAWVNLDDWYVLGPLLVGLCCVGRWVAPGPDAPRPPLWLLPACLVACLASPHHVRGLTLPAELSPAVWGGAFPDDPRFAGLFASPWRFGPLGAAGGINLAAWGFWACSGSGWPRSWRTGGRPSGGGAWPGSGSPSWPAGRSGSSRSSPWSPAR